MIKFRKQTSTLEESMANVKEFSTKEDLISFLQNMVSNSKNPRYFHPDTLLIEETFLDPRNGWNTSILRVENIGILGFVTFTE